MTLCVNNDWVSYLPSGNWYNMLSEWIYGNNYLKKKKIKIIILTVLRLIL